MDKNTNVHTKVGATFVSVYYNALAEGKIAEVTKMYLPTAKVSHYNVEGVAAALAAYAKGARFNITTVETTLANNTSAKIFVKGTVTIGTEKKDFQQDIELFHHGTTASQLSFGVASDSVRASAVPPPPKMKFDDWAADTPQLAAQSETADAVPTMDLITTPQVTPQVTPKVAPKAATPAEEKKVEEAPVAVAPVAAPKVEEEKKVEEAPAAPKGWANIVRADKTGPKVVVSVVDPTKKVAPKEEKKTEEKAEGEKKPKGERKPKAEGEEAPEGAKERRSNRAATPIFYDVFVKGFPVGTAEADITAALSITVAISNVKVDTKEDRGGVKRVFVYIKLSAEDLAAQKLTREAAIAAIVAANKGAKHNGSRLTVEEVKERFNADGTPVNAKK